MIVRHQTRPRVRPSQRRGLMSIEVVASIAVMLPICAALLFTGVKICQALYQTIGTLVSWPFL